MTSETSPEHDAATEQPAQEPPGQELPAQELPEVLQPLADLDSLPVSEHPERFSRVLDDLTNVLESDLP